MHSKKKSQARDTPSEEAPSNSLKHTIQERYAQELTALNAAYAEPPTPEEQEMQRLMWELTKRQLAKEPW